MADCQGLMSSRASDILLADDTTVLIEGDSYNNILTIQNNELIRIDIMVSSKQLIIIIFIRINNAYTLYI